MAKVKTIIWAGFAVGTLMVCQALAAQEPARQTPPEGGTPKDFTLPAKQQFELANGLKVTMVPFGKIPKVTLSARIMAGNLNEGENTWLADLTAQLMEEGTTSRSSEDVAREAAEMGGSLAISVGPDQTSITGEALAEYAPGMVALMADVILNPALPESELDRLRRDSLRNLEVALNCKVIRSIRSETSIRVISVRNERIFSWRACLIRKRFEPPSSRLLRIGKSGQRRL